MAWKGKIVPLQTPEIEYRHFVETARRCGYGDRIEATLAELAEAVPGAIAEVGKSLPTEFPDDVYSHPGIQLVTPAIAPGTFLHQRYLYSFAHIFVEQFQCRRYSISRSL